MALSEDQKKKVFWAGAIDHLPDPVRTTRWRFIVPTDIFKLVGVECTNGVHFGTEGGEDEFALHVNGSMKVPKASTRAAKMNYMGFEKNFPVQQEGLAGTISPQVLLLEDMRAYEAMLAWNQTCFNQGILSNTGKNDAIHESDRTANEGNNQIYLGLGQQENHNNTYAGLLRNASIRMELYDWMYGNVILSVLFVNAWPSTVGEITGFEYGQAQLAKFSVTFTYDRFNLFIPPNYKVV